MGIRTTRTEITSETKKEREKERRERVAVLDTNGLFTKASTPYEKIQTTRRNLAQSFTSDKKNGHRFGRRPGHDQEEKFSSGSNFHGGFSCRGNIPQYCPSTEYNYHEYAASTRWSRWFAFGARVHVNRTNCKLDEIRELIRVERKLEFGIVSRERALSATIVYGLMLKQPIAKRTRAICPL